MENICCLLEEGIEKAKSGWLKKMVEDGAQNEIGVVGAKLWKRQETTSRRDDSWRKGHDSLCCRKK